MCLRQISCGLFLVAMAATAGAQSTGRGTSMGVQTARLFEAAAVPPCPAPDTSEGSGLPGCALDVAAQATSIPIVRFETWIENVSANYAESVFGDFSKIERRDRGITLERFVRDNFRLVHVGYSITVESLPDPGSYFVTLSDAGAPDVSQLRPKGDWKVASPAHYLVPQIVREGDEIAIELHTAGDGVRLVDYIQIGAKDKLTPRKESPRDSYAEDAEFILTRPRLRVNGLEQDSVPLPETLAGGIFWIYAPGYGRCVLAYMPHPELGMERSGEVSGTRMLLVFDGNSIRIDGGERIAPGGAIYNVYGFRDAMWEPADPTDRGKFMAGTSPGL